MFFCQSFLIPFVTNFFIFGNDFLNPRQRKNKTLVYRRKKPFSFRYPLAAAEHFHADDFGAEVFYLADNKIIRVKKFDDVIYSFYFYIHVYILALKKNYENILFFL